MNYQINLIQDFNDLDDKIEIGNIDDEFQNFQFNNPNEKISNSVLSQEEIEKENSKTQKEKKKCSQKTKFVLFS